MISRISKAKKVLYQEHGRQPREEEVAAMVGLTVEKMKSVIKSARAPTSMERPIGKEADTTVGVSNAISFSFVKPGSHLTDFFKNL